MQHQHQASVVHSSINPNTPPLVLDASDITNQSITSLQRIGISPNVPALHRADCAACEYISMTMDDTPTQPITTGSITTATQFAQQILPGIVRVATAERTIDRLAGMNIIGKWADTQIIQAIVGNSGTPSLYTDSGNIPLANWNLNWELRTNRRFEMGFTSGILEQELAAMVRVASAAEKRYGVIEALEILRNEIGFFGFNDGFGRTFGFFNDPGLPATEVSDADWTQNDFEAITNSITQFAVALQVSGLGKIDVRNQPINFAYPLSRDQFLNAKTTLGYTARQWIRDTYPNWILYAIPQMDDSDNNGIADTICFLYAESVMGSGTDDGKVVIQMVPQKFRTLGVEQRAKGYVEDSSNATAGILWKRPFACVRFSGL